MLLAFGARIRRSGLLLLLLIFAGIVMVNFDHRASNSTAQILGVLPVLIAAFAYPIGNQLVQEGRNGGRGWIPALTDADLVIGYRIKRRDPWHRLVVAAVYHFVLRIVFRLGVHDVDCAFKLFRRPVVDALVGDLRSRSAFISPELVIRSRLAGFRLVEVGVPHHPRVAGTPGGASPKVILRTIREIWALRSDLRSR